MSRTRLHVIRMLCGSPWASLLDIILGPGNLDFFATQASIATSTST